MKKTFIFITSLVLLLIFLFGLTSCPEDFDDLATDTITIVNNSEKTLYYWFQTKKYPDTTFMERNYFLEDLYSKNSIIYPFSEKEDISSWGLTYSDTVYHSSTFMLFLFDVDVVETVPWNTIRENYMILRRFDFTEDDLDSLNWTLTYP